jgi:hypothetical protein
MKRVPLFEFTLNGQFVRQHPSLVAAAQALHVFPQMVTKHLSGKVKSIRQRVLSRSPQFPGYQTNPRFITTAILAYDLTTDGRLIGNYHTLVEASHATGIGRRTIYNQCCKPTSIRNRGDYRFFFQAGKVASHIPLERIYQIDSHGHIVDRFRTLEAAGAAIGERGQSIQRSIQRKQPFAGYRWERRYCIEMIERNSPAG